METINQLEHSVDRLLRVVIHLREENRNLREALEKKQTEQSDEVRLLKEELVREKTLKDAVLVKVDDLIKKLAELED